MITKTFRKISLTKVTPKTSKTGAKRRSGLAYGGDPEVRDIAYRICGDHDKTIKLATRFLNLKQKFKTMTLPEALAYIWLESEHIDFQYQAEAFGARRFFGGVVPDFMLFETGVVWRIQGNYWHSRPERIGQDVEQKIKLANAVIDGRKVTAVVDVWESRILSCNRDYVFRLAVNGEELGK